MVGRVVKTSYPLMELVTSYQDVEANSDDFICRIGRIISRFALLAFSRTLCCLYLYGGNLIFINRSSREVWQPGTPQIGCFLIFVYFSLVKVIKMLTAA